jgi:hypothetical protein
MSRKLRHITTGLLVFVGLLFSSSPLFAAPTGKGLHLITQEKAHKRLQYRKHRDITGDQQISWNTQSRTAQRQ